ncbi:MAG TPA: Holliday junction resolvase RuvX [Planctomycetota bacterium]|nr:Holliday junction resolvase RuvX [Planctomycetota bacterium]
MLNALALDPGTKRIGVAACDPLGISVKPLPFIPAEPEAEALVTIAAVVADRQVQAIVIGLPINMDGTEGPAAKKSRDFAERLRAALPHPAPEIVLWDESLTTDEAEKRLLERGLSHRERKQVIDSLSAAILLKSWLDAQPKAE